MKKLLFIMFILILLTIACSKTDVEKKEINLEEITDSEIKEFLENKLPEPKQTTYDKIDLAEEGGTIDEVQANTLRIIAGYTPEALPSSYKSEEMPGRTSLQAAKIWLRKNWDTLDEETQELLYPYKVLPNHPDSYLNKPTTTEKITETLSIIPSVSALDYEGKYITHTISETPNRIANIYYKDSSKKQQAEWIANAYDKSFKMYEPYFGIKPDQTTYFFIKPMGDYGTADTDVIDDKKRCIIEIKEGMNEQMTKSTTAHELFHCFQFYLPLEYSPSDMQWLMEATATWSEHYVYPEYNKEHEYIDGFFYDLNLNMIYYGNTREYQSYMWYLFQTQYANDINAPITALKAAKTKSATDAATEINGFNDLFSDFALWNVNYGPAKKYQDSPKFPSKTPAGGGSYSEFSYKKDLELPETTIMERLGMGYHVVMFKPDVKKAVIKFDDRGDEEHQRQALVKIGNTWHIEDWTDLEERKFCLNRAEEKVTMIIMIFSNSDKTADYNEEFTVNTKDECQPTWHGTLKVSWNQFYQPDWMDPLVTRTLKTSGSYTATEELYFDDNHNTYDVISHTGLYNAERLKRDDYNQDCGYIYTSSEETYSGIYSKEYDKKNPGPKRLEIEYDYYDEPLNKTSIKLTPLGKDWVNYRDVKSGKEITCASGTEKSFINPIEGTTTADFSMPTDSEIKVEMDPDAKKIIGSTTYDVKSGEWGNYKINVDYHYEYS